MIKNIGGIDVTLHDNGEQLSAVVGKKQLL